MFHGGELAANDEFVYILQGHTLYQFSAGELRLLKRVPLELGEGEAAAPEGGGAGR
jgi:hypothetical protein